MAQDTNQIEPAGLVIGLAPPSHDAEQLRHAIERIVSVTPPVRAVLLHPPFAQNGEPAAAVPPQWQIAANTQLAQDSSALAQSFADSYRAVFDVTRTVGARGCAVIASDLATVTPDWIAVLLQPILEGQYDLVAPRYAMHPFDGMINRAIVYPLLRALYGKRVRNPLGPDFGISAGLLERLAERARTRLHPLASLTAEAATGGMRICEANLGPRVYSLPDAANLSSLLTQVLAPLFLDVERYAPFWQRGRGSQPVPAFGGEQFAEAAGEPHDVSRLLESFRLGASNLPEIWSMILAPSTLVELKRLARVEAAAFRMPDETWARIVYDFALAYRMRTINRDQMLRSLTPIYLGWLASYTLEAERMLPQDAEARVEDLCTAFENTKSHFVARWRWPDRFNP